MLEVRLLGQFEIQLDGRPVEISSHAAQLLLAYLLLNPGAPLRREKLAGLFWPESAEANARSSLRHAAWRLRKALPVQPDPLLTDNHTIGWNPAVAYQLDTTLLERAAPGDTLDAQARALSAYRGELLPGFYEEWVGFERERLAAVFAHRMQDWLDGLAAAGRWPEVIAGAERWIALGQAPEPAYRALIQAHALAGDIGAAATAYQRCAEALARDLAVEPSEQTRRLYEQVRQAARGARPLAVPPETAAAPPAPATSGLPSLNTAFVGREQELAMVAERLGDPNCRLLTLTGPGGIGKTRLALQAAGQAAGFADGAQFVRLSTVNTADALVAAMAESLHFPFYGGADAIVQLIDFLRPKRLLLLLDNFEHLLDGAETLALILRSAPEVKFLVTSQERLNLQGEWLLEVEGMPIPAGERLALGEVAGYGALQLFVACARRVDANFSLRSEDLPDIIRICRLVGGTPLGIELAASWLRAISIGEVAQEIERSLQFLATTQRDLPERHRSLQAVFDHSWNRLSPAEQRVYCRLAVFSGGFTREAAAEVAGASLADLSSLMDKSLLRRLGTGRYAMHGLLREFAQVRLDDLGERAAVCDRHLDYFLGLAEQAEPALRGPDQLTWLWRLDTEHDNLRRALEWARQTRRPAGPQLAGDLARFWYLRGSWREGREWLAAMLAPEAQPAGPADDCARSARARALAGLGWLADEDGSEEPLYREGLALFRAVGDEWGAAYCLRGLGSKLYNDGNLAEAAGLLAESLAIYQSQQDQWGLGLVRYNQGWVAFGRDDLGGARAEWLTGLEHFRRTGDRWGIAVSLGALTYLARQNDEYTLAASLSEEGLALFRDLGDRAGIAMSLLRLAQIAFRRSNYPLAITLLEESQTLHEDMGDKRGLVNAKSLLGVVHGYQGRYPEAAALLHASWAIGQQVWGPASYPFLLNYLGLLPYLQGQLDQADEYWQRAASVQREQDDRLGTAFSLWGLGAVAVSRGQLERAFDLLESSLALFRQINDQRYMGIVLNALARAERARGQPERARALVLESLVQRRKSADRQGLAEGFETLAALRVTGDLSDLERAARLFGLAEALRAAIGAPLPPVDQPDYNAAVLELQRHLAAQGAGGQQLLESAWQAGRALAVEPLETIWQAALAGEALPEAAASMAHRSSWVNA